MPSTTAPSRASARMPATFVRRSMTSFGHLIWTASPVSRSSASATATPATSASCGRGRSDRRVQQHGSEQGVPRRRLPRAAEAAAARGLEVGGRDRPFRHRGVEQLLRRGAGVDVDPRLAERHAFSQTETCFVLSLVNGSRLQPPQRSRSRHPRQLRHQVELRRPDVAKRHRDELEAPVDESEVVRCEPLGRDVVLVDRPSAYRSHGRRAWCRRAAAAGAPGHRARSTKHPPGSRCAAAFRKQATCASCVVRLPIVLKTTYASENASVDASSSRSRRL